MKDPFGQFQWLESRLEHYRRSGTKAFITGHIPPIIDSYSGKEQWHVKYIERYQSLVRKYRDVVACQLFGHVHSVEFRIPNSPGSIPPVFTVGSISPLFGNNPTFSVWKYDAENHTLVDWLIYGTNITEVRDWVGGKNANISYCVGTTMGTFIFNKGVR